MGGIERRKILLMEERERVSVTLDHMIYIYIYAPATMHEFIKSLYGFY